MWGSRPKLPAGLAGWTLDLGLISSRRAPCRPWTQAWLSLARPAWCSSGADQAQIDPSLCPSLWQAVPHLSLETSSPRGTYAREPAVWSDLTDMHTLIMQKVASKLLPLLAAGWHRPHTAHSTTLCGCSERGLRMPALLVQIQLCTLHLLLPPAGAAPQQVRAFVSVRAEISMHPGARLDERACVCGRTVHRQAQGV